MTDPLPDSKYTCGRCRMNFHITEPDVRAERHVCPECRLPFWSARSTANRNIVRVGIYPSELVP